MKIQNYEENNFTSDGHPIFYCTVLSNWLVCLHEVNHTSLKQYQLHSFVHKPEKLTHLLTFSESWIAPTFIFHQQSCLGHLGQEDKNLKQRTLSPDGKYLAYSACEDIYLIPVEANKFVKLSANNPLVIKIGAGVDPVW